jgi:hypothetical protein
MRAVILLLVVLSAGLVASCGEQSSRPAQNSTPPAWTDYQSAKWGFEVRFPRSWRRGTEPVTPKLTEPREILSVATFPLRYRPTNCEAFAGSARGDLGPRDAFLTVHERGYDEASEWLDFPPRPERFRPTQDNAKDPEPDCGDRRAATCAGSTSPTQGAISTSSSPWAPLHPQSGGPPGGSSTPSDSTRT